MAEILSYIGAALSWIAAALVWFWQTRTKHRFDKDLEAFKAEIQESLERRSAPHTTAQASLLAAQKVVMGRRLDAVDRLWGWVLSLTKRMLPVASFLDVYEPDTSVEGVDMWNIVKKTHSLDAFANLIKDDEPPLEMTRPYVGETLWALWVGYRMVLISISVGYSSSLAKNKSISTENRRWYKNKAIRRLMESVLDNSELRKIDAHGAGQLASFLEIMQRKIIANMQKVISGEDIAAESLEQAAVIMQRATELEEESERVLPKETLLGKSVSL